MTTTTDTNAPPMAAVPGPLAPADGSTLSPAMDAPKPYLSIRPSSGWAAVDLAEVWRFRDLLMSLASRDLKLRYKQTALGVIWVVLQPLMAAGIFSFVFGKLSKFDSFGVPFFLFTYVGLLAWNLFSGTLSRTSGCLVGNSQLISKVFFPRLVLPLSAVPSVLVDFAVAAGMLVVLMVIAHRAPTWRLLTAPLWMAVLLMASMGVGLCTAALTVSYRDVQYILPVATQMLLYGSPIFWSLAELDERGLPRWERALVLANPLAAPLEAFRWSVLSVTPQPPGWPLLYSAVAAVAVFFIGAFSFKRMERQFADVI